MESKTSTDDIEFTQDVIPLPTTIGRNRVLNYRLFIPSVILLALALPGVFWWHGVQIRQQVRVFLAAAGDAEEADDYATASAWLFRYLGYVPDDLDAQTRYGKALVKSAVDENGLHRAIRVFSDVVEADPSRADALLELGEAQLTVGAYDQAQRTSADLLSKTPMDPAALRLRARALDRAKLFGIRIPIADVARAYEDAHEADAGDIATAQRLAIIYREYNTELANSENFMSADRLGQRADRIMDELVRHSRDKVDALLARHYYRQQYALPQTIAQGQTLEEDLAEAYRLDPNRSEVHLAAAQFLMGVQLRATVLEFHELPNDVEKQRLAEARGHLEAALRENPQDPRPYFGLSIQHTIMGEIDAALEILRRGLRANPGNAFLLAHLADLAVRNGRWQESEDAIDRLEQLIENNRSRAEASELETQRAIVLVLRGSWYASPSNPRGNLTLAASTLNQVAELARSSAIAARIHQRVGLLYSELGNFDLAVRHFEQATALNPSALFNWLGTAEALREAGRYEEATRQFEQILRAIKVPGADTAPIHLGLARAQMQLQLRKPKDRQDWAKFHEAIAKAKELDPKSALPLLMDLESRVLVAVDDPATLRKQLQDGENQYGENAEFWFSAANLYLVMGDPGDAERAIERYEALSKTNAFPVRARIALIRGDLEGSRQWIAQATKDANLIARGDILVAQAEFAMQQLGFVETRTVLEHLTSLDEKNVPLWSLVAQLAAYAQDAKELEQAERALVAIEGERGTHWRFCRVHRLLLSGLDGNADALQDAARQAEELVNLRPGWSLALSCQGDVFQAMGRIDSALDSYRDAFRAGDRRPLLLHSLFGLLSLKDLNDELGSYTETISNSAMVRPEILAMCVRSLIRREMPEDAIALARLAADAHPIAPETHIWLGIALLRHPVESERPKAVLAFQKAVQVAPQDLAAWVALLHFSLGNAHPDSTVLTLQSVRALSSLLHTDGDTLDPAILSLMIGRFLELDGEIRIAEGFYRKALQESNGSLRSAIPAGAVVTTDSSASPASTRVSRLRYAPEPVRKLFALTAGVMAGEDAEAVDEFLDASPRLQAVLAAAQGGPARRKTAVALLDRIPADEVQPGDLLLRARLHRSLSRPESALADFRALAERRPTFENLGEFADRALEQGKLDDARFALERLEQLGAASPGTVALRVRVALESGQREEAIRMAREFAESAKDLDSGRRMTLELTAADWLDRLGESDAARSLATSAVGGARNGKLILADWLATKSSFADEAARLCLESDTYQTAWTTARVLMNGKVDAELAKQAEALIARQLQATPALTDLCSAVSLLREHQGRTDESIALCESVLAENPNDVAQINNHAWLIAAYRQQFTEARTSINRAIRLLGPQSAILDTAAIIELGEGRNERAIALLETCIDLPNASSTMYLHLAEAYQAVGAADSARWALSVAKRLGLEPLVPRDRKALSALETRTESARATGGP